MIFETNIKNVKKLLRKKIFWAILQDSFIWIFEKTSEMAPAKKHEHFTDAVIVEVQNHPSLWDKRHKDYKDIVVKSNDWHNIFANLSATYQEDTAFSDFIGSVDDIKNIWKNVRDTYTRKKKKAKGQSGAGLQDVKAEWGWVFFEALRYT